MMVFPPSGSPTDFSFSEKLHELCGVPLVAKCFRVHQMLHCYVTSLCLNSFTNLIALLICLMLVDSSTVMSPTGNNLRIVWMTRGCDRGWQMQGEWICSIDDTCGHLIIVIKWCVYQISPWFIPTWHDRVNENLFCRFMDDDLGHWVFGISALVLLGSYWLWISTCDTPKSPVVDTAIRLLVTSVSQG